MTLKYRGLNGQPSSVSCEVFFKIQRISKTSERYKEIEKLKSLVQDVSNTVKKYLPSETFTFRNQNTGKVRKGPAEANVLMYTSAYGDKQVHFAKFQLSKMYRF